MLLDEKIGELFFSHSNDCERFTSLQHDVTGPQLTSPTVMEMTSSAEVRPASTLRTPSSRKRAHAEFAGALPQHQSRGALVDHVADFVVDHKNLEYAHPAFVTGLAALSHPTGFITCASDSWPGSIRSARNSVSVSSPGCLHLLHSRRTSRCAMIARTDDATRNGCTPMSIKRATAEGASLVCSVLKTRWPVRLAFVAMLAVSRSRISPIMMMFGAWRSMERNAAGNVMPISVFTCTWLIPLI